APAGEAVLRSTRSEPGGSSVRGPGVGRREVDAGDAGQTDVRAAEVPFGHVRTAGGVTAAEAGRLSARLRAAGIGRGAGGVDPDDGADARHAVEQYVERH